MTNVGYQGSAGSFSHIAARRHFPLRAPNDFRGFESFRAMLDAVRARSVTCAVLPIENTTAGSIHESYDLLAQMDLALVGEEIQQVEHCLIGLPDAPISGLRRVYSHPQALMQCSDFLARLGDCRIEAFSDTATAVAKIKGDGDTTQAAIASTEAADLHGLPVLVRDIANQRENFTRMVIVAPEPTEHSTDVPCKTSLMFATRHERGALVRCLNVLATHDLSLTKLESRPRPHTPFEYLFYVDFEGNTEAPEVRQALGELSTCTVLLKVFGSYPRKSIGVR